MGTTSAICALIASATTLAVAVFVADRRAAAEARADALDRAETFLREIESEIDANEDPAHLAHEVEEFAHGAMRIAVDRHDRRVHGPATLPEFRGPGCAFRDGQDGAWLVCAASGRAGYRVRAGQPQAELWAHRRSLMAGGFAALLVVVLGSVGAGLVVARWSLAPLTRLRDALDARGSNPRDDHPPLPTSGLAEVDVVVSTVDRLVTRLGTELERSQRFAADAAHELRTPLAKLSAELELIAESTAPRVDARHVDGLMRRVRSLSALVERLLLLASPGDAIRTDGLVSLAATAETVAAQVDSSRVILDITDDGLVTGDATVLEVMVRNAVDNGLKFSGGLVTVAVMRVDDRVVLRLDDEGPGLSAEDRERAFQPFFRAARDRNAPGHGVGLALIAHVASAHGGAVAFVGSAPGAHLEVSLPHRSVPPA